MGQLILRYEFEADDDFGWLDAEVKTDKISGRGGFWVQWQDVEEFGRSLRAYPISPDAPLRGAWGFEPWKGDSITIRIEVVPANSRGDLKVEVEVADHIEPTERLRASFLTNYPQLEAFSESIGKMINRQTDEAVLTGS
jgi:hypothetical protein